MSYQVLARKWRPSLFSEMVGQNHTLDTLIHALDHDRLHHAYLFTGTRGVGKTTVARIFAKSLNCETGVSSTPCNVCSTCEAINAGQFVDLIEVDGASKTKVEDTRDMLDQVQYAPTVGRFKVYLIDEVHMLSNHSFNALLKTLEEPPPHIKFLLATTDPQKLPVTVLSRCLQFSLKNLMPEQIIDYLNKVLVGENINFEAPALTELALSADGSMRDALSLTDQAIAHGSGSITLDSVNQMLGTIDRTKVSELLDTIIDNNGSVLLQLIDDMAQFSPHYLMVLDELISLLHRIAIAQINPNQPSIFSDNEQVKGFANDQRLSGATLQVYYQLAIVGRRDIALAPDAKTGFEMVMLRMLSYQLVSEPQAMVNDITSTPTSAEKEPSITEASTAKQTTSDDENSQAQKETIDKPLSIPQPFYWAEFYNQHQHGVSDVKINLILLNSCLVSIEDKHLNFTLAEQHQSLLNDDIHLAMETELSALFSVTITVNLSIASAIHQTPADYDTWLKQNEEDNKIQEFKEDPMIALLQSSGATLDESSLK